MLPSPRQQQRHRHRPRPTRPSPRHHPPAARNKGKSNRQGQTCQGRGSAPPRDRRPPTAQRPWPHRQRTDRQPLLRLSPCPAHRRPPPGEATNSAQPQRPRSSRTSRPGRAPSGRSAWRRSSCRRRLRPRRAATTKAQRSPLQQAFEAEFTPSEALPLFFSPSFKKYGLELTRQPRLRWFETDCRSSRSLFFFLDGGRRLFQC